MADNRYRDRGSSIFSDDDDRGRGGERWRSEDYGWGPSSGGSRSQDYRRDDSRGSTEDRGFFERAGDEVRSWFGDDEAERRREEDARRWEREQGRSGGFQGSREDQWRSDSTGRGGYERSRMSGYGQVHGRGAFGGQSTQSFGQGQQGDNHGWTGQERGFGQDGGQMGGDRQSRFGQRGQSFGGSPHDESYRRWRDQQIEALDSEYEDYCRHRQEQFEQDFSSFRQNRQSSITSGGPTMSQGGQSGAGTGQNAASTTTGAGNASASTASTGSSGAMSESSGGGRGGKSR